MTVPIRALDVVVGIPQERAQEYATFAVHAGPADVVLTHTDPVLLSGAFTLAVVERTEHLAVHAAVVHGPGGALIVPGASGLGKSTLTAALVQAGFGLLSDEMLAIDRDSGEVLGFPRPITLDQRSRRALGLPVFPGTDERAETVASLAELGRLGPARSRPVTVLVATRGGDGPASLEPAGAGDAAAALIENSFNHYRSPQSSLAAIGRLASTVTVLRLAYSEAAQAAETIAAMLSVSGRPL